MSGILKFQKTEGHPWTYMNAIHKELNGQIYFQDKITKQIHL